ncbi:MAG: excinuclease ABC subunit UvrA [bacterium]
MSGWITIKGARQHNLKNIHVALPKNQLVVVTGPSGAGKSSLAFDTLYAEGQRRYVESLSPATRQFLTQLEKPDVDAIEGLGPAIAIQQRAGSSSPRSTVGTVSDIHDFLRLLYARVAVPHCHRCGLPIRGHSVQQVVDEALARPGGPRLTVCAPRPHDPELDFADTLERYRREGFVRIRIGGETFRLEEEVPAPQGEAPEIALVVDRISLKNPDRQRLSEAVEQAYHFGEGLALLLFGGDGEQEAVTYSATPSCTACGIAYPEAHPRIFSFNGPYGACPTCHGLGHEETIAVDRVVPDPGKTLADGAIAPWGRKSSPAFYRMLEQVADHFGFSIFDPFGELSPAHQQVLLHGSGEEVLEFTYEGEDSGYRYTRTFEGAIPNLERRYRETESPAVREEIRRYMTRRECAECHGARLRRESLHYLLGGRSIAQVSRLSLEEARSWAQTLELSEVQAQIAAKLIDEVSRRLSFLIDVGLHYLTLDRTMDTLSSGEAQRILLATQIGSALSGVIYILDEPTVGLHQRDTARLLITLRGLRDVGNTVVVVEHDRDTLREADYLIEIGPSAGEGGGQVVAVGTPAEVMAQPGSVTGSYLKGEHGIPLPRQRRPPTWQKLSLRGAATHNLKGIDVEIPLRMMVCVTGVSGSGKSSLILDTLLPALQERLYRSQVEPPALEGLEGIEYLDKVIHVDQAPIGRSRRSNPATYLGVFSKIREHFALLPESRARGYSMRRFSFNVAGGRCDTCQGEGTKRIEMHFLPDVFVRCDVCGGSRYNRETLEIRYRGKSIADILSLTVEQAEGFFQAITAIRDRLRPMIRVGLGYLRLGQPATTLSSGEAQRLKIARELGRRETGRTLYILDEPTTGLHVDDIQRLLDVLDGLVESGNSVLLIEHNMEVIKCADHLIELGPEGGDAGGAIVGQGTPEELLRNAPESHTASYLAEYLAGKAGEIETRAADKERVLHNDRTSPV